MSQTQSVKKNRRSHRTEVQLSLAQFFTPITIADFMAGFLYFEKSKPVKLLDAGAGLGILGNSVIELLKERQKNGSVQATFIEFDDATYQKLENILTTHKSSVDIDTYQGDFVDIGIDWARKKRKFTHIIINPPYFKLKTDSDASVKLRQHEIHVTNIYAAFMWLSAELLEDGGELVAIVPRSFCNGTYFTKFRQFLAKSYSIDAIHSFNQRNKAFAEDSVLQENIIIKISKQKQVDLIQLSYSDGNNFNDMKRRTIDRELVISELDEARVIHIPSEKQTIILNNYLSYTLEDIGLNVSTGPVVDFRLQKNVFFAPSKTTIPLLYSQHMNGSRIEWPRETLKKKAQHYKPVESKTAPFPFIDKDEITDKNALPLDGYYIVVRRFSSKEEKRRIFASIVDPAHFKTKYISFENHLNYFHINKHGLEKDIAYGLCAYLNSSILDEHFRKVSGHTQVNVGDLKKIPYPSVIQLKNIGVLSQETNNLSNDAVLEKILGDIR